MAEYGFADFMAGFSGKEADVSERNFLKKWLWATILACALAGMTALAADSAELEIPIVSAEIGKCAVQFTVRDPEKKPL